LLFFIFKGDGESWAVFILTDRVTKGKGDVDNTFGLDPQFYNMLRYLNLLWLRPLKISSVLPGKVIYHLSMSFTST